MAMRSLLRYYHRDTQPGAVHSIALKSVVSLCGKSRIETVFKRLLSPGVCSEHSPQHAAMLLIYEFPVLVGNAGNRPFRSLGLLVHRPSERTEELSELLLDRHPVKEVGCTLLDRKVRILIVRCLV